MMRLPPFEYLAPNSVEEAVQLLAQRGRDAMVVAGGTDLFPNMKRRQFEPKVLVGLSGIAELRATSRKAGFVIGAGTTLSALSRDADLQAAYPALTTAAGSVSSPQLRNAGTLGGNLCLDTRCNYYDQSYFWRKAIGFCMKKDGDICLVAPGSSRCWAISSTDCAPVVVALDAQVRLVGPKGAREIPAADLYRDDGMDYMTRTPDEILTQVKLPPADGIRSVYLKLRRRGSIDFPILGVACALRLASDHTVERAHIVLGAVASHPLRAVEAERVLLGQRLEPDLIAAAAEAAYTLARPMDNADAAYAWRKKMVRVYVERALKMLTEE